MRMIGAHWRRWETKGHAEGVDWYPQTKVGLKGVLQRVGPMSGNWYTCMRQGGLGAFIK